MARTIKHCKQAREPWETKGLYVHHEGPHAFHAYQDGWSRGKTERTYSAAAAWLFLPRGAGCYNLSYYPIADDGDLVGDELCSDCALAEWLADPAARFIVESDDNDRQYESTAYCDGCNAIISPQLCPHCGDALDEYPYHFRYASPDQDVNPVIPQLPPLMHDYYIMHARCMADLVASGRATKTGKGTYHVPGSTRDPETGFYNSDGEWFHGTYRTPQAKGDN